MNEVDLQFQRYAHDRSLGGTAPGVDGGPVDRKRTTQLTPQVHQAMFGDKTLSTELEKAFKDLEDLLK